MGVSRATFPRDEGWHFLNAGQALERAEMTARIVDVQYHALVEGPARWWETPTTINGWRCSSRWRRTSSIAASTTRASTRSGSPSCCVLHPQHPRSLRFSVSVLQSALRAISGSGPDTYANEAERLTGRLYDGLKYDRIEDIFARGLHAFLAEAQHTCRAIGEQVARTYFYYEVGT